MKNYVDTRINNCYFGYGGIVVGVKYQTIIFKGIKPPVGVGNCTFDVDNCIKIGEWTYTDENLYITFNNMDEINNFCIALKKIEEDKGGFFKFKDIILDFTYYKQESMNVVKNAMEHIRHNMLYLTAC